MEWGDAEVKTKYLKIVIPIHVLPGRNGAIGQVVALLVEAVDFKHVPGFATTTIVSCDY